MRKVTYITVAAALMTFAIFALWSYRVRAAGEAAEFLPTTKSVLLPAGSAIETVLRNGIASSAAVGDSVTAFVSAPVIFKGRVVIPAGAHLKGRLEQLSVAGATGKARLSFTDLLIRSRSYSIQTGDVNVVIPVQSDIAILGAALSTPMAATLGAVVGAASGDIRLIIRGLYEGAGVPEPEKAQVPITVVLALDLIS
jgi:hypothetical protein